MRSGINRVLKIVCCLALASMASAQIASRAPATVKTAASTPATAPAKVMVPQPVARVNGAVITENDVTRMTYTIFPYARLHGGVPEQMKTEMRKGALEMVIFEELLYQEAQRRKLQVAPEKLARAEAAFRKQFHSRAVYEQFLLLEANGSRR